MSEAGNKANQNASFKGHSEDDDEHQPETNPNPACQVLDAVVFTELQRNTKNQNTFALSPSTILESN